MQMMPLISILIPVFNRELIIAETIKSALAQSYKNIEIVIVDNSSTDNTWSIIKDFADKDSRVKPFRNERNVGPVRNWLRCVELATGEYGKILWSDDLIAPDFIEKTMGLFTEEVGFVYTGAKIFKGSDPQDSQTSYLLPRTGLYPTSDYIDKALFSYGVPFSPGCAIFRMADLHKNLFLNIPNRVDSDFSMHAIGNDLLLFLLTAKGYRLFGHIAEPLSFFRFHDESISVSSSKGKLPLHYALAMSYFVENYMPSLKNCFASKIKILLLAYRKSSDYGMNTVSDFFREPVKFNKLCFIKLLASKTFRVLRFVIGKSIK